MVFVRSVVCLAGYSLDVALAFEDAQAVPFFFKEETDDTDHTYDTRDFPQIIRLSLRARGGTMYRFCPRIVVL